METNKIIAAGVLPICFKTKRVLLSRRHPHVMYGDTWASWGGKFEHGIDVTPQDCAKREFWEETRISTPYHFVEEPVHIYEDERVVYYTFLGFFDSEVEADILTEGGLADQGWFLLEGLPENLMPEFRVMMEAEMDKLKRMTEEAGLNAPIFASHHPARAETDLSIASIIKEVDRNELVRQRDKPNIRIVGPEEFAKPDNNGE